MDNYVLTDNYQFFYNSPVNQVERHLANAKSALDQINSYVKSGELKFLSKTNLFITVAYAEEDTEQKIADLTELVASETDAAIEAGYFDLNTVSARMEAVNQLKGKDDFEPLAIAFKRVVNIIKEPVIGKADIKVFEQDQEKALYERFLEIKTQVEKQLNKGDYQAMALSMAGLRESVDKFFDDVMVMVEDIKLRENRLRLLNEIREMFFLLADFSKLTTE